jgi:hypothetical protein
MPATAARSESWTYASGRVAAMEGKLLDRDALARLAAADSPAAFAGALAESPLRGPLSEVDRPADAAKVIGEYYASVLHSLEADCPFPQMFELVALPSRFGGLKERVREGLAGRRPADLSSEDRLEMLEDFDADGEAAAGLELLIAVLEEEGSEQLEPALDLALDSSRLLESLRLAATLGDEVVLGHVEDEVKVRAALLLWRSRLIAESDEDAPSRRWVPRLFLRGELGRGMAPRLWNARLESWYGILGEELSKALGGELFGRGEEDRLSNWERTAFDWLTARARELRGEAFGVGRVYAYAWGLAVEERNVRLAAVGRLRGVETAAITELLWESYA